MKVIYENPGVDYMIRQIMAFQTQEESAFWSEPLYHFYPQLDKAYAAALPFSQRCDYIEETMRRVYEEIEPQINEKVRLYTEEWVLRQPQIESALSDAFGVDCHMLFQDLRCRVCMNPVEPRYLREQCFDTFYLNSPQGAIGEAIHEIIHFVWFYVWNRLFGDDYAEYERPSMKWILSEMVVESVMRDPRLSQINPYFPREHGGCIYPYFFDMEVDGVNVLDTLDAMYRSRDIEAFMKDSYAYCCSHEAQIRGHIRKSEG